MFTQSSGALQEYVVLDAGTSARVPDGMGEEEVAGLPSCAITAVLGFVPICLDFLNFRCVVGLGWSLMMQGHWMLLRSCGLLSESLIGS